MRNIPQLLSILVLMMACKTDVKTNQDFKQVSADYLDYSRSGDQATGGIRMIPVNTPKGKFNVWTKRVGNNPSMRLLLLHGGPGGTHEVFECYDGFLPYEGIEYIYYDQLGSYYSDQPNDTSLWSMDRFVEEVEQVRKALGLNKDNFYILGQSGGGILAIEYAMKYQDNLKGLIISNMMSSIPEYNRFAQEVLGPKLPPEVFSEIKELEANNDFLNPRYNELLMEHYYTEHILRMPLDQWPESVNRAFKHMNMNIYVYMQGYSEFGITGDATLKYWDRSKDLNKINVPTLIIGASHDTMDPTHMEWMSKEVQNGRFLLCANGSHISQYDDQENYFPGLIKFIRDVNEGNF